MTALGRVIRQTVHKDIFFCMDGTEKGGDKWQGTFVFFWGRGFGDGERVGVEGAPRAAGKSGRETQTE